MRKQSHLSSSASRPATVESEEDEDEDEVILPLATSQPRSKATSPLRPFIKKTRRSRSLCVGMAGDNVISLTPVLNAL